MMPTVSRPRSPPRWWTGALPRSGAEGTATERGYFARETALVARSVLGAELITGAGSTHEVRARIVEVEAYLGSDDPASHAYRGPTPRASIMFGPPGRLYVYLSYGMHCCANIVTGPPGTAGAVLLRAAEVLAGEETVRSRRALAAGVRPLPRHALLSGPGNLCRGLGIDRTANGADLCAPGSTIRVQPGDDHSRPLVVGPRVGISRAADSPLRFALRAHAAMSRPRL